MNGYKWILKTRDDNIPEMVELLESARIDYVFQDMGNHMVRLSVRNKDVEKAHDTLAAKFMRSSSSRMD
jgi:hypothetical protein